MPCKKKKNHLFHSHLSIHTPPAHWSTLQPRPPASARRRPTARRGKLESQPSQSARPTDRPPVPRARPLSAASQLRSSQRPTGPEARASEPAGKGESAGRAMGGGSEEAGVGKQRRLHAGKTARSSRGLEPGNATNQAAKQPNERRRGPSWYVVSKQIKEKEEEIKKKNAQRLSFKFALSRSR
ncbi:hypothetical protein BDY21DRAFT_119065 [Lineolata rhizophorae]|uniref:Uncharacterized protein n=1 Tax=Lineolata rhizophorae TaxID=578093 RepID=A0A6A6NQT6_9PEZI|nr:hypothetical protein BDY21DRAFT_119065 [Lineolata rhizophorae]